MSNNYIQMCHKEIQEAEKQDKERIAILSREQVKQIYPEIKSNEYLKSLIDSKSY